MPIEVAVHVVKVGGSLVTRDDFIPSLRGWVNRQLEMTATHLVLLIGGGPLVDALRELDALRPTDQELVHWTAIELMEATGQLVADWSGEWPVECLFEGLRERTSEPGATIFLPQEFLRRQEPLLAGLPLPMGWQVTSDSIAARVAEVLGAERLTLLKSQLPPAGTWQEWGSVGFVDEHFWRGASGVLQVSAEVLPGGTVCRDDDGGAGRRNVNP